ncbi:MAG: D-aminoacylase [Vicinamibacterales bacterium]|jgi:N-acyl-D-amino-acid deacylase|nr:aminoacylase [Acidobacteriota bacterium]MDP6372291.1 D-aminoacylase [Vicinamibacterales bacterium]MDP6607652.1 D-aminoacylase [Vicinamibacterales bacterium]HAK54766.1 aminoacylase [Acidobacteriota bacterium]|tara:strand:- start:26996 stop:28717 length:1722 start_codon:yes stop_codon:yes gene_type:complete
MTHPIRFAAVATLVVASLAGCASAPEHDLIIRNGTIIDGSGAPSFVGDLAIDGDRIAAVGHLGNARGVTEVDAAGLAIAPGFVNMLSWAGDALIEDGRSQGDIRQGVTLEVFGEGTSGGPLTDQMKNLEVTSQGDIMFDVEWTTLGEYLEHLETKGISPNVASFVGATTLRVHEIGYEDRPPTDDELDRMRALVRQAMEEGAVGIGSSLIYAPAFYAQTDELIELSKVAAEYDGLYISHMRSEGNALLESVDELLTISRESGIRAEIYHLKAGGQSNWDKLDAVIERVEAARAEGLQITANMYNYTAGSTGLDAGMPPWVQEGGYDDWAERLGDPAIRDRVRQEMTTPTNAWENLLLAAGAEGTLLVGFKNPALRGYIGQTLAAVAEARGTSVADTAMDLVIEDGSRVQVVYFLMSEENVARQIALPWVSFCSDAGSYATEGVFLNTSTHPRAYGNFARLLGRYVRDERVIPLEEAVRKLTSLPATNLRIRDRGQLAPGFFADVVAFDPATIQDRATYEEPHQYAVGMVHVWVNGTPVLQDGDHTGATPGRALRGPGWTGWAETSAEATEGGR